MSSPILPSQLTLAHVRTAISALWDKIGTDNGSAAKAPVWGTGIQPTKIGAAAPQTLSDQFTAAMTTASQAQTASLAAATQLAAIANANVLSQGQKISVIQDLSLLQAAQTGLDSQASTAGVSSAAFDQSMTNLVDYLNGAFPGTYGDGTLGAAQGVGIGSQDWSNTDDDSIIDGPTWMAAWNAAYIAMQNLQAAVVNATGGSVAAINAANAAAVAYVKTASVANLMSNYVANQSQIQWDGLPVTGVLFEVRLGPVYATAKILGQLAVTSITTVSDGTYWVTPCYQQTYGVPTSIVVSGTTLVANVVATSDEAATGWSGTLSGGALADATLGLKLQGGTLFDAISTTVQIDAITARWDEMGGVQPAGAYEVPSSHFVDLANAQVCQVSASFQSNAMVADTTWAGSNAPAAASASLWLAIAGQNGVFGAYQAFAPGQYMGRIFKMKVVLASTDPMVTPLVPTFVWTVDVPDRICQGTAVAVPAAGMTITYPTPFQIRPNLQVCILNAVQGDYATVTGDTKSGFTVQCFNAGTAVSRSIHWIAQAY